MNLNDNLKSDLLIDDDNDEDSNEDMRLTADISQDSMTSDHKWCWGLIESQELSRK